jgi:hypothetical protein
MLSVVILTKSYSNSMHKTISNNVQEVIFSLTTVSMFSTVLFLLLGSGDYVEKQEASCKLTFHKVALTAENYS